MVNAVFRCLSLALLVGLPTQALSFSALSSSVRLASSRGLASSSSSSSRFASQRRTEPAMMAKKVTKVIKLALAAGTATPAPPVGPALGSAGANIMMFCKEYNARTQDQKGTIIPVEISVYEDRSFSFILKTPPASELLKKAAKISKGSGFPAGREYAKAGEVTTAQIEEIAKIKLPDLNTNKIQSAMNTVKGTAKNMGIVVVD